jgi:hypothetical protein
MPNLDNLQCLQGFYRLADGVAAHADVAHEAQLGRHRGARGEPSFDDQVDDRLADLVAALGSRQCCLPVYFDHWHAAWGDILRHAKSVDGALDRHAIAAYGLPGIGRSTSYFLVHIGRRTTPTPPRKPSRFR